MVDTNKIKARIIELNYTQAFIAQQMGIKQSTLSLKIRNRHPMTCDEAERLQDILQIPDQDFKIYFFSRVSRQNATIET